MLVQVSLDEIKAMGYEIKTLRSMQGYSKCNSCVIKTSKYGCHDIYRFREMPCERIQKEGVNVFVKGANFGIAKYDELVHMKLAIENVHS